MGNINNYIATVLAALLLCLPLQGWANPYDTFASAADTQIKGIKTLITKTKVQRRHNKYQERAARKYTRIVDKTGLKLKSRVNKDKSKLHLAMSKFASTNDIVRAIKSFNSRISHLNAARRGIDKIIRRMDRDKAKWWIKNGKLLDGKHRLDRKTINWLSYWVHVYGTEKRSFFGMKTHSMVSLKKGVRPRQYRGAIEDEKIYLNKFSRKLAGLAGIYKRSVKDLNRRLQKHKNDLAKKKGKKAPSGRKHVKMPELSGGEM